MRVNARLRSSITPAVIATLVLPAAAAMAFASPLQVVDLSPVLSSATIGQLPVGWKASGGDWAVRLAQIPAPETSDRASVPKPSDQADEAGNLILRCLSTDRIGGTVIDTAQKFSDFTLNYQMQHFLDRGFETNRCQFRVQFDGHQGYTLRRESTGALSLMVTDAKGERVLSTSTLTIRAAKGQWIWLRLTAEGNRFRVWASPDGLNYQQYLDVIDDQNTFTSGNIGFSAPNRYRFGFAPNPWHSDARKLAAGAWIERAEQAPAFCQSAGSSTTFYQALVDFYIANLAKAPTSVRIADGATKQTATIVAPHLGVNSVSLFAPLAASSAKRAFNITLQRGTTPVDRAAVTLENRFDPAKLVAANPVPVPAVDETTPVSKADYMKLIDQSFAATGYVDGGMSWDDRWGAEAELYRATGDKKYLDAVIGWARRWLHDRDTGKAEYLNFNFASRPGFAEAAAAALQNGDLTPSEKQEFLAIVSDVIANDAQEGGGVINRALGYAVASKPLLALVPDHPLRHVALRFHDEVLNDFLHTYEGQENSDNYLPITWSMIVKLIDQTDPRLYQDPRVKNTFENILERLDPDGGLPQIGDYGGPRDLPIKLLPVLERAATVYQDGRFKWAAHNLYRRIAQRFNPKNFNGYDLEELVDAYAYADDSIPETPPTNGSAVLCRNDGHLDKLSLRSGWGVNDFHVLVDLLSGCEHGDDMALSVLSAYKNGGQCLMDKGPRDITGHSVPLVREASSDYPYLKKNLAPGQWRFASFDLRLFASWNMFIGGLGSPMAQQYIYHPAYLYSNVPTDFSYDPARQFSFALELAGSGRVKVYLDDVKLVKSGREPGKNAAELTLEDFEGPAYGWIGNFQKSTDAHSGHGSGEFLLDFSQSGYIGKKFQMPLDIWDAKYDRIQFWYKVVPVEGETTTWTLHLGDASGTPRNYGANFANNDPVRQTYFKDCTATTFAGFSLKQHANNGQLVDKEREFFFIKNKLLWVRDRISATGGSPWVAGPLWQVGTPALTHGANWYDSYQDNSLLVWFPPKTDESIELYSDPHPSSTPPGWHRTYPFVLYEKARLVGGAAPKVFDALLIPHDGTEDAQKIAASIKVLYDENNVTLVAVGADLLLINPSGHAVSIDGLDTDYQRLYLQQKADSVVAAEGEGGTHARYRGQTLQVH